MLRSSFLPIACVCAILLSFTPATTRAKKVDEENPGTEGDGNHTIGPEYKKDPDLTDRGHPKGKSFQFKMRLADSNIFQGLDQTPTPKKKAVGKEREISVYVPAAYQDGTKAPILVTHDGPNRLGLVRNALDNRAQDPEETYHNWVMANWRTAAALEAKSYHYRFVFSRGTRHCDRRVFEETLADTLVWTWRGYKPEGGVR